MYIKEGVAGKSMYSKSQMEELHCKMVWLKVRFLSVHIVLVLNIERRILTLINILMIILLVVNLVLPFYLFKKNRERWEN